MTRPSAFAHAFTIRRNYDATPEDVFNAFADPAMKAKWFSGPPDQWHVLERRMDFREGGEERVRGKFKDAYVSDFRARYHVIRKPALIVYVYDMYVDDRLLSTSLSSFDFAKGARGTDMTYVEQGVYYEGDEGGDGPTSREEGTQGLFDRVAEALAGRLG
ncbi:MAG: SRPBCC domain-containing protein [Parvularculaceae bacterium]|nr:SRPBCC domain-containing protein [Parvularculaceae bacterium]